MDYSNQALASLDESGGSGGLNENLGINAGSKDITTYVCPAPRTSM